MRVVSSPPQASKRLGDAPLCCWFGRRQVEKMMRKAREAEVSPDRPSQIPIKSTNIVGKACVWESWAYPWEYTQLTVPRNYEEGHAQDGRSQGARSLKRQAGRHLCLCLCLYSALYLLWSAQGSPLVLGAVFLFLPTCRHELASQDSTHLNRP